MIKIKRYILHLFLSLPKIINNKKELTLNNENINIKNNNNNRRRE